MEHNAEVIIRLENVVKSYDDEQILKSINLDIRDKEFITLLGPSGCGKTTTLRIIGGFETPDGGHVYFDGKDVKAYIEELAASMVAEQPAEESTEENNENA